MTTVPLSQVVNKSFVQGFQNAASSGSKSSNPLKNATAVSLSESLRYGAQLYGDAIQNFNSVAAFLNISDGKLENLLSLTDKMITLAETATQRGIGSETRLDLDRQFRRYADQFGKIVRDSSSEERDPLSIESLTALFSIIGLDEEQSDSIAKFFKRFLEAPSDTDALASDEYLAQRPIAVPTDASTIYKRTGSAQFSLDDTVHFENATAGNQAYGVTHADLNNDGKQDIIATYNSPAGYQSRVTVSLGNGDGTFQIPIVSAAGGASGTSGYQGSTVIDHDADGDLDVAAISDNGLTVFTNNGSGSLSIYQDFIETTTNISIEAAEVTGDTTTDLIYFSTPNTIKVRTGASNFAASQSSTILPAGFYGHGFKVVDFNQDTKLDIVGAYDDGTASEYGFFVSLGNGDGTFQTATRTTTSYLMDKVAVGDFNNDFKLDIAGQGETWPLYVALGDGVSSFSSVTSYGAGAAGSAVAVGDINNDHNDDILYRDDASSGGNTYQVIALLGNGDGTFQSGITVPNTAATYTSAGTVNSIDLFDANRDSTLDVITNELVAAGTSSNIHLNEPTIQKIRAPIPSDNYSSIFDEERTLTSRVEAYRVLTDLKSLREQIVGNRKVLEGGREILIKNMDLIRATGLALLEISDEITDATTAEEVAEMLKRQIRSKASAALSQAEHLTPITVAALALARD